VHVESTEVEVVQVFVTDVVTEVVVVVIQVV